MIFPPISVEGAVVSLSSRHSNRLLVVSSTGQSHIISSHEASEQPIDVKTFVDVPSPDEFPIAASFNRSGDEYCMITSLSRMLTRAEHSGGIVGVSVHDRVHPRSDEAWVLQDCPVSLEPLYDQAANCSLIGFGRGAVVWDDRTSSVTWGTAPLPSPQNDDRGYEPRLIGAVSVQGPVVVSATFDGFVLSYDVRAATKTPFSVAQIENDTLCCVSAQGQARSVVLGGALGKAYNCRVTHSPNIEQCISTGSVRSLIRCVASHSQQIFCGHIDGRISALSTVDGDSHANTTVASLSGFVGHHRHASVSEGRSSTEAAGVTVPAICATEEMMWAAFSTLDSEASTIVGVAAHNSTGIVSLA